jgi:hypothetical protein
MTEKHDDRVRDLIDAGTEIAGGATSAGVGVILGTAVAGPPGAIVGGALGGAAAHVLRRAGEEISERLLGAREKVRVGAVLALAAEDIRARAAAGEKLRGDGFFAKEPHRRSQADEVAESVLLKAQREPEERKIPFIALLMSGIAFDASISVELAHQLTKAAEQLTYRQFCVLRLAVVKDQFSLRSTDYRGHGSFGTELLQLLYECFDLYHRGFINFGGEVAFGPSDVKPGAMTVQGLGAFLYNLMRLSGIPEADIRQIELQLR